MGLDRNLQLKIRKSSKLYQIHGAATSLKNLAHSCASIGKYKPLERNTILHER